MSTGTVFRKFGKESASLIIVGKNSMSNKKESSNYKLLVLKRSKNSSFLPSSMVFAGGATEKADTIGKWKSFYNNFGISNDKLKEITKVTGSRSEIFQTPSDEQLDRNISLRLTAIRETFEELGILICKTKDELLKSNQFYAKEYKKFDQKYWQKEVHEDASKFLTLCQKLNVAPDLWCSYEWCTWLTPAQLGGRYNTAFFLIALENQPDILAERNEVEEYMWETPENLFKLNQTQEIFIPHPQLYEVARLCQINDIAVLTKFAKERNKKGTTLFFPVLYETIDGVVVILPGDDLYPRYLDPTLKATDMDKYRDKTTIELREMVKNHHRKEYTPWNIHTYKLLINIQPLDEHIHPIQ